MKVRVLVVVLLHTGENESEVKKGRSKKEERD